MTSKNLNKIFLNHSKNLIILFFVGLATGGYILHTDYGIYAINSSLDTLPYIESKQICQNSRDVSSRILCLPIFPGLKEEEQQHIIQTIVTAL